MDWLTVLALVGFGIGLMLVEFIFIPGTTVVGFLGFALTIFGVYLSYDKFGNTVGTTVLSVSMVTTLAGLYYSLKSGVWERFSLKDTIDSRVNEDVSLPVVGEMGVAVSALRPSGKAEFNDAIYEVHTFGSLVDTGATIKIMKVEGTKIWVTELPE